MDSGVNVTIPFDYDEMSISLYVYLQPVPQEVRRVILDNRDLEKECGFRLSIVDIAPGKDIVEVTFYDAQRRLHSIQSAPRDLHDRWSHVLFTSSVAEAQRSLLSVEVDGVTLLSSAVSRGLPSQQPLHLGSTADGHDRFAGLIGP
ncbi:hypothetical protein WA577_007330, partial [Blastocystis sp. JDR]